MKLGLKILGINANPLVTRNFIILDFFKLVDKHFYTVLNFITFLLKKYKPKEFIVTKT